MGPPALECTSKLALSTSVSLSCIFSRCSETHPCRLLSEHQPHIKKRDLLRGAPDCTDGNDLQMQKDPSQYHFVAKETDAAIVKLQAILL